MSYKNNYDAAARAVKQVAKKMTIGASNRGITRSSPPVKRICASQVKHMAVQALKRQELDREFKSKSICPIDEPPDFLDLTKAERKFAEQEGCGNCAEQVSIALWFLVDANEPVNIDLIDLAPMDIDHQFLVVGLSDQADARSPKTWDRDAVICDPWHNSSVYPVSKIDEKMYRGSSDAAQPISKVQHLAQARWNGEYHDVQLGRSWIPN